MEHHQDTAVGPTATNANEQSATMGESLVGELPAPILPYFSIHQSFVNWYTMTLQAVKKKGNGGVQVTFTEPLPTPALKGKKKLNGTSVRYCIHPFEVM